MGLAEAVETVPVHEIYGGWPALSLLLSHPIRALAKEVQFLWPLGMVRDFAMEPPIFSHKLPIPSSNSSRSGMGVWEWDLPLLGGSPGASTIACFLSTAVAIRFQNHLTSLEWSKAQTGNKVKIGDSTTRQARRESKEYIINDKYGRMERYVVPKQMQQRLFGELLT